MNLQFWKKSPTGLEAAVSLVGFVLAHAAWSVSDLLEGELLVPLAMTEKAGQRELHRFAAETREQAIASSKTAMGELSAKVDAWAFAAMIDSMRAPAMLT
jgi:hypothetical protein